MNDVDEILDFDDNGDFNFSEDPQVADSNLMEGDGMFDLDAEMSFATGEQRAEVEKFSTEEENKEISEPTNNQLSENTELDDNSTVAQQKDQEELKYDDFDMDDPDFLKEYGDVSGDVTIEDDEFWKELGLDPPNEVVKEENESITEKSGTTDKIDTDNTNISKSIPKENAPKKQPSQSDAAKVNSTKLDVSGNKPVKRTSKSPEEEDGEIINTSTSSDRQQQPQKQKSSQSQQQTQTQRQVQTQRTQVQRQQQQNNHQQPSSQNYRGRGNRRNDWRPVNNNGSFLGNNMSSFRSGFGPGLEGMPGIPMGQIPHMLPGLNMPPGMIGPNIHVNPNFARLRPHALPFQYPMGSGGPPMNMMPYQGQMDMHPYHPSMTPMGSGRGNNTSYGRGGSPGFNHHSSASTRRPQINQQNNNNQPQRPSQPSPKRKVPNDGFDQKEPDSKKVSVTNGKPSTPDAKPSPASQKNAEKSKVTSSPVTTKNTSSSTVAKTSNFKQGTSTANTNKTASAATKNKVTPTSDSRSGSTPTKQTPKPAQKPVPKNTARNVPTKAVDVKTVDASTDASKSTATSSAAPASGNKLTIGNVVERVTKRDIQDLANKVPGGSLSITFDRSAQTAEVVFKTSEGAKIFRRKYNRSVLCGSNIIVNFS